jgi:hypothetical protein
MRDRLWRIGLLVGKLLNGGLPQTIEQRTGDERFACKIGCQRVDGIGRVPQTAQLLVQIFCRNGSIAGAGQRFV